MVGVAPAVQFELHYVETILIFVLKLIRCLVAYRFKYKFSMVKINKIAAKSGVLGGGGSRKKSSTGEFSRLQERRHRFGEGAPSWAHQNYP